MHHDFLRLSGLKASPGVNSSEYVMSVRTGPCASTACWRMCLKKSLPSTKYFSNRSMRQTFHEKSLPLQVGSEMLVIKVSTMAVHSSPILHRGDNPSPQRRGVLGQGSIPKRKEVQGQSPVPKGKKVQGQAGAQSQQWQGSRPGSSPKREKGSRPGSSSNKKGVQGQGPTQNKFQRCSTSFAEHKVTLSSVTQGSPLFLTQL
jgi:hypothetical protein